MSLERRGRELWAEFDDPDWNGHGESLPRIQRQVVMLTGSHQQQVYWYRTAYNRLLGQLPGMYLIDERRWIPRRAAFLRPPPEHGYSETGRWNAVCIDCHATNGKRRLNAILGSQPIETLEAGTTVAEFGIACEACHGPSDEHVQANRNPLRRYRLHLTGDRDPTIVNPTRLTARLSSQVCGQCHGTSLQYDRAGVPPPDAGAPPYRPGSDLDRTHFVAAADAKPRLADDAHDPGERSGRLPGFVLVGRHDSRLGAGIQRAHRLAVFQGRPTTSGARCPASRATRCTRRRTTRGRSTEWADTHQVSAGMNGDEACLQCHPALRADLTAHTKHRAASAGSSCYNCHMPYTIVRSAESVAEPSDQQPHSGGQRADRPAQCLQPVPSRQDAGVDGRASREMVRDAAGSARARTSGRLPRRLLWLLRGDAGQRALVAWSMGWQPAQQASGTGLDGAVAFGAHERSVRGGTIHRPPLPAIAARVRQLRLRVHGATIRAIRRSHEGDGSLAALRFAGSGAQRPGPAA